MSKRLHLIISGQVQGVSFRFYAQQEATELNIKGFARNSAEEAVEIVAEGEENSLKAFLEWCQKGSPFAKVKKVESQWHDSTGEFESFEIL